MKTATICVVLPNGRTHIRTTLNARTMADLVRIIATTLRMIARRAGVSTLTLDYTVRVV